MEKAEAGEVRIDTTGESTADAEAETTTGQILRTAVIAHLAVNVASVNGTITMVGTEGVATAPGSKAGTGLGRRIDLAPMAEAIVLAGHQAHTDGTETTTTAILTAFRVGMGVMCRMCNSW